MTTETTTPVNARIRVRVYADHTGRVRWRIRSASRGRRVLAVSSEAYTHKSDAFRSLLLTTGGVYNHLFRSRALCNRRGVYEQGEIVRRVDGQLESIFVEYVSAGAR